MTRVAHWLRPNAKTELPSNMVFVDTETRPEHIEPGREKHSLWFGYACYIRIREKNGKEWQHEEWLYFERAGDFWDWVCEKNRQGSKLYVFAHNWNFDGAILWTASELRSRDYQTLQYINNKPPFILRLKQGKRFLALVDTLNYFGTSLANLGESIGIEKKEMPGYDEDLETWKPYCRRDVEVIRDAVLQYRAFIEREDLGNFRPTVASQAFNAFRHRFYTGGILIHNDTATLRLERDAYFGGRVECFQIGEVHKKLYYLDVNSLYPFIMAEHTFPKELVGVERAISIERLGELLKNYALVADVTLDTDENIYPTRQDNRLIFPVGVFRTSLCTPELAYALAHNHITAVHVVAVYEEGELFRDYVETLYAARQAYQQAGNPAFAYLCKIFLNSFYGKFGQKGQVWETLRDAEEDDPPEWLDQEYEGGPVFKHRVRLGVVQKLTRDEEARESFPTISGHVTAYARLYMWQLMKTAGLEHVYYTDTDSLIVDSVGRRFLDSYIDPSRLGALKVEKTATQAAFYGPKDYVFGTTRRTKGVRQDAREIERGVFEQIQFHSWDWHQKETEEGFIYIDTVTKKLRREYKKGNVQDDGRVEPYRFGG